MKGMIIKSRNCIQWPWAHFTKEIYIYFHLYKPKTMAIINSCVLYVEHWQSEHLDCILVTGNNLNLTIKRTHEYLLVS